jgi:hypothetical protein
VPPLLLEDRQREASITIDFPYRWRPLRHLGRSSSSSYEAVGIAVGRALRPTGFSNGACPKFGLQATYAGAWPYLLGFRLIVHLALDFDNFGHSSEDTFVDTVKKRRKIKFMSK